MNDIRESTASCAQNSNTSESCILYHVQLYPSFFSIGLAAEDLLIKQAIALPSLSENEASNEDATNSSTDKTSGMKFTAAYPLTLILLLSHFRWSCWSYHFNG